MRARRALAGRAAGPLVSHLGAFVTSLIEQQYAAGRYPHQGAAWD